MQIIEAAFLLRGASRTVTIGAFGPLGISAL